jgi:hypothetical protein
LPSHPRFAVTTPAQFELHRNESAIKRISADARVYRAVHAFFDPRKRPAGLLSILIDRGKGASRSGSIGL